MADWVMKLKLEVTMESVIIVKQLPPSQAAVITTV